MLRFALALCAVLLAPASAAAFDWVGQVEAEAEGLKARDPEKRLLTVQRLGQYDIRWSKPHLLRALGDADLNVRTAAGRLLGRSQVTEAVAIVSEWLTRPGVEDKKVAAEILGAIGSKDAVMPLIRSLGDLDYEVRLQVVLALGRIGGDRAVVPLIARLEDDKPEVRRAAVDVLLEIGDKRAVVPLVGVFDDSTLEVREAAIGAVGRLGDAAAVPALLRLLRDPNESARLATVTALGNIRSDRAIPFLVDMLAQGSNEARAKVAYALGQIAGRTADPVAVNSAVVPLVAALGDNRVRAAAREALLAAGASAVPALLAQLRGEIPGESEEVVGLLRDIGDRRATPALVDELDRARLRRELVLGALEKIADPRALVPVLTLLGSEDPDVRVRAMRALDGMVHPGGRGSDVLILALADRNDEVRARAASYLGRMKAAAAVPSLIALLGKEKSLEVRQGAATALGDIGDARAVPALVALLVKGPRPLHGAAATALSFVGSEQALPPLIELAESKSYASRPLVVRALGAICRDKSVRRVRGTLEDLADDGPTRIAVAALDALGAMRDGRAADTVADLTGSDDLQRRRAAVQALGNFTGGEGRGALLAAMKSQDGKVSSAAAWALGKRREKNAIEPLIAATRRRDFATPINASAALALVATRADEKQIGALLYHKQPLVRSNAAQAAGRVGATSLKKSLTTLLEKDASWRVRRSAAQALSRLDARAVLKAARENERNNEVQTALDVGANLPFAPPPRNEWRTFAFVDPARGDAPLVDEPYVLYAADGLATVLYTNANGEATEEAFPAGPYRLDPALRAAD